MKTLSLDLDLKGIEIAPSDKELSNAEIAVRIMSNIMIGWAHEQKGLGYHDQRKYNKIMDKLEEAIEEGSTSVELEDDQFGFLRKCMVEGKMLPAKIVNRVFNLIDAVKYD